MTFKIKVLFAVLLMCVGFQAHAAVVITSIHELIPPSEARPKYLVLATVDGAIYRLSPLKVEALHVLQDAVKKKNSVILRTFGRNIRDVRTASRVEAEAHSVLYPDMFSEVINGISRVDGTFQPSVLNQEYQAHDLFNSLKDVGPFKRRSQCYQRAHLWSWHLYTQSQVSTMKAILFFTRKYIEEFDYKWWFHISPFTYVGDQERVLDYKFTRKPMSMNEWTAQFMKNKADCPEISNYADYADHQLEAWCYLRKVPMYYYRPIDV